MSLARAGVSTSAVVLLLALVFLGSRNLILGILGIGLAGFLAFVAAVGADRAGTFFVALGMFTAPMNAVRPLAGGSITFSDLFFVVGFGLLAPAMLQRQQSRVPTQFAAGSIIIVIAVCLSSVLSPTPFIGLNYGGRLVAAAVFLPLAFLLWRPSTRIIDVLAGAYLAGQSLSSLYSLVEGKTFGNRYDGLSTHPNFFALGAIIGIAMIVHLWHRLPRHRVVLLAPAVLLAIWAVQASGSRAAILVVAMMAAVYPFVERSAVSAVLVLAGGATSVLLLNWLIERAAPGSALARLGGDRSTSGSDSVRENALQIGWDKFLEHPIIGKSFGLDALDAHNIYLEVMVGIGLFGLVGFLLVGATAIMPMFGTGPMRRLSYAAFGFAAVGMLTNSLWDRFIWAGLSLSILAAVLTEADDAVVPEPLAAEAS